jgi:acyl-CoA dehydrogenase
MTEDVVLLEEQARRFVDAEFAPHLERWNEAGMYERDVWTKAGAAGLLCASMPEEYGGAGGSFAHEVAINRAFSLAGFDAFGAPLHSGIVAPYILHYGTQEQKRRWLPRLATGELVGAIAMPEPGAGSHLQGVRTRAVRHGNGYVLNGAKTFITNGQHANLVVVVAKTDPAADAKGISLMVVETDEVQGFRRGRKLKKLGFDAADTSELFFEEVALPAESLLGTAENQGFAQLMSKLPQERLMVAVHAQAMIERALELTVDYVKQRGRSAARSSSSRTPSSCSPNARPRRRWRGVRRSLRRPPDRGRARHRHRVDGEVLGHRHRGKNRRPLPAIVRGYGYMDEYPISRMYRDSRVLRIMRAPTRS